MGENQKINYLVLQANDNLIKTKIKMQKLKKNNNYNKNKMLTYEIELKKLHIVLFHSI